MVYHLGVRENVLDGRTGGSLRMRSSRAPASICGIRLFRLLETFMLVLA